jgi:8-oxo-dGTP diphosphatase
MSDSDSPTSSSCLSPQLKSLWVVAAVIRHGNQIFAAKRKAGGGSGLKWEFPGGKVEAGESAPQALQREIFEELGIGIEVGPLIGTLTTPLEKHSILLECYWCTSQDREVTLASHEEAGWFEPNELQVLDWALPDVPVLEVVLRTLASQSPSGIS